MARTVTVGLVIADEGEFRPLEGYVPAGGRCEAGEWRGYRSLLLTAPAGENLLQMRAVLCGIGLSQAAAATAFLIADGAEAVCNEGLSGAMQGLRRGELVVGTSFIQHDYDGVGLGYVRGQISGHPPVLPPVGDLTDRFLALHPELKRGRLISGDEFVCSAARKEALIAAFDPMACDMETAAVVVTCRRCGVPTLVVRQAADDAGDGATETYRAINENLDHGLAALLFDSLRVLYGASA